MPKQLYLVLAAILLLCLIPGMPYGYFTLVRLLATVAFSVMAYRYFMRRRSGMMWTLITLALLFQPFAKVGLGRTVWNVIDVVVAIGLVVLFFVERKEAEGKDKEPRLLPPDDVQKLDTLDDNRFEFSLKGKLAPKELIYVASEEDKTLEELFEKQPEVFEGWGMMTGFHIVYLPLLMRRLASKEVLQYRAPYLTEAELKTAAVGNDFLLQYLTHPDDRKRIKQGFIRTEDIHRSGNKKVAVNRFYPLSSKGMESIGEQLHRIERQILKEKYSPNLLPPEDKGQNVYADHRDISYCKVEEDADRSFNSQLDDEDTNDLMEEVRERIAKLRQRGIAEKILEQLLHPDDRPSRMVITKDYRIILPDYNNMEIKMEPLVKAVFLLFLNHPEGIFFKDLPDYREELTRIYLKLKPEGLTERVTRSIEDVTNPTLNSINEKCARIRGAFVGQFDNHIARHYYIDGRRGDVKRISLPRNLVDWVTT